jgi:hypothetical protein
MININDYIKIDGNSQIDYFVYPVLYKPFNIDYTKDFFKRYFAQKINDLSIVEISEDQFNMVSSQLYIKKSLNWKINGPKNNIYKGRILDTQGVQESNLQSIDVLSKDIKNIKQYLNNPLEYWSGNI